MDKMAFKIVAEYGHYTVYLNGNFFASADSQKEAQEIIDDFVIEYLLK